MHVCVYACIDEYSLSGSLLDERLLPLINVIVLVFVSLLLSNIHTDILTLSHYNIPISIRVSVSVNVPIYYFR